MGSSLHGKKILITREENQAKVFSEKVLQCGGIPIEVPLLKISCKHNLENSRQVKNLQQYKWIFFTSINGAHCFFDVLKANGIPTDSILGCQIAAVGHKTNEALKEHGISADFIPSTYNADVMAAEFLTTFSNVAPVLLVRGNRSRDVLPEQFSKNFITFDMIEVYETAYNYENSEALYEQLIGNDFDYITFTSPSTVEAFSKMTADKDVPNRVKKMECVCIGTTTEQKATEIGFTNILIPDEFTIDGMIETIADYIKKG